MRNKHFIANVMIAAFMVSISVTLAEEVHTRSVSRGSSSSVVFSTAERYPVWRLHVKAAGYPDCKHKSGTQSPNDTTWSIVHTSAEWYKWKCAIVSDNTELYFQQKFTGDLICTNTPTGGGGVATNKGWTITGKLDDYRIIPEEVTLCVGQTTNFYAFAGTDTNILIHSEWSLAVTNDLTNVNPVSLSNGTSVSFSIGEAGEYTLTGHAVDEGGTPVGASDTAKLNIIKVDLELEGECSVSTTDGLVEPWPHSLLWRPALPLASSIPEFLSRGDDLLNINLLPEDMYALSYTLSSSTWSNTPQIQIHDTVAKTGGEYTFDISSLGFVPDSMEASWGGCTKSIDLEGGVTRVELPYYGTFYTNAMNSYGAIAELVERVNTIQDTVNGGIASVSEALSIPISDYYSLDLGVIEKLPDINVAVTRQHEVWLWPDLDCCLRAEKDLQRTDDSVDISYEKNVENATATAVANLLYSRVVSGTPLEDILSAGLEIPGFGEVVVADIIKTKMAEIIATKYIKDKFVLKASLKRDRRTDFEFCAERRYAKDIQKTENLGLEKYGFQVSTLIQIDSLKDILSSTPSGAFIYSFISDNFLGGNDWGWTVIEAKPVAVKTDYTFTGGSVGVYTDGDGKHLHNIQRTWWYAGAGTLLRWKMWEEGELLTDHIGRNVVSWNPLVVTPVATPTSLFAYPAVVPFSEEFIRIGVADLSYVPTCPSAE